MEIGDRVIVRRISSSTSYEALKNLIGEEGTIRDDLGEDYNSQTWWVVFDDGGACSLYDCDLEVIPQSRMIAKVPVDDMDVMDVWTLLHYYDYVCRNESEEDQKAMRKYLMTRYTISSLLDEIEDICNINIGGK